jgi:hypothetical protein
MGFKHGLRYVDLFGYETQSCKCSVTIKCQRQLWSDEEKTKKKLFLSANLNFVS